MRAAHHISREEHHAPPHPRRADHRLRQADRHRQFDRPRAGREGRHGRRLRCAPGRRRQRVQRAGRHRHELGRRRHAWSRRSRKAGGTASSVLGDVSHEADANRMVDEVLARYGRLDILVNNAGAPQGADRNEIEDVPVAAWDLTMGVNAKGAFLMSRAAVPAMRKAKWGRIVSVSSKAAFRPGTQPRDLCRVEGGDRRLHQVAGARPRAVRDHGQRRLPRPDPHLARDQHQPPRIRRRPRNRLPRAVEGDPGRPLRQPRRGRLDDRLPRLRRGRLRHRPGDRRRRRLVRKAVTPRAGGREPGMTGGDQRRGLSAPLKNACAFRPT